MPRILDTWDIWKYPFHQGYHLKNGDELSFNRALENLILDVITEKNTVDIREKCYVLISIYSLVIHFFSNGQGWFAQGDGPISVQFWITISRLQDLF